MKKTIKITKKATKKTRGGIYSIVLEIAGVKYKSNGKTINEALENLGLTWVQIKGKGILKVKWGKKTLEHLFFLKELKRIFSNKITRLIWEKRLKLLLK